MSVDPHDLRNDIKIVIVDDFPTITRVMKNILSNDLLFNNHNIKLIYGDDAAVQLLKYIESLEADGPELAYKIPDALFIDWNMPSLTGIEALRKVRNSENRRVANMLVVMVTAENQREQIIEAIEAGVSSFIVKPPSPSAVESKLSDLSAIQLQNAKDYLKQLEEAKIKLDMSTKEKDELISKIIITVNKSIALDINNQEAKEFKLKLNDNYYEYFNRVSSKKTAGGSEMVNEGKYKSATGMYVDALRLNPSDITAQLALGQMHMKSTDYGKAVTSFESALKLKPSNAKVLELLGEAQLKLGSVTGDGNMIAKAVKTLKHATTLQAEKKAQASTIEKLAKAYKEQKDDAKAEKAYKDALELGGKQVAHLMNLGIAYKKAGKINEAQEILKQAAELTPTNPQEQIAMGNLFLEQDDKKKAMHFFNLAIKQISKEDIEMYEEIIDSLLIKDMLKEAQPLVDTIIDDRPDIYNLIALSYSRQERYGEAIEAYNKVIAKDATGEREGYFYNRGMAYLKNGDNEKAKADFTEAYKSNTDFEAAKQKLESIGTDLATVKVADPAMEARAKKEDKK